MSRPSPQEQAEIDAASEPTRADCRKCKHATFAISDGGAARCGAYRNTKISPEMVDSPEYPCVTFSPASPALASPPVSADREGTDAEIRELADAAAGIRRYAVGDYFGNRAYAAAVERYESALLLPGVVAARFGKVAPAVEDPRDATIRDLRAALDAVLKAANREATTAAERNWTSVARVVGMRKELDGRMALLGRCATALAGFVEGHSVHGSGCLCPKCIEGRATLAALRSAGVEPTPEAQKGKAGR